MGYTTDFSGRIEVYPPLSEKERAFLLKFSETRRMSRQKGPYYVDGNGFMGQDNEPDVINYNSPAEGQPGLWCQWVPTDDGSGIVWNGCEKFYHSEEWMVYLIEHFLGKGAKARGKLRFLKMHVLNGEIEAQGEDTDDRWKLVVKNNVVSVKRGHIVYE